MIGTGDWVAYRLTGSGARATTLFRGTHLQCSAYVRENYVPGKGSLHIAYRPRK